MTLSTEDESVPAVVGDPATGDDGSDAPRKRRWGWWVAFGIVGVLVASTVGAFMVEVPYFEFRPGSARPVAPLVVAEDTETYEPAGDIAFTTVTLRRTTIGSYVLAWFDDDVVVYEERRILGDRSPTENRQFNLQLMDTSKQDAIRLALLALGYEVDIDIEGVVIVSILEGSVADGQVQVGETIVSIDGVAIDTPSRVSEVMSDKAPGDTVRLELDPPTRDGTRSLDIVLGANPEDATKGLIGVTLEPRNPVYDFPFPIDIESGNVGGDSAGLAFTLGVLDVLTPGELTGGFRVATTGTIDPAGIVGPVGGVRQKTAAVIDSGYDVFLVPPQEFEEAAARAGDALQVISVSTLQEALDALESLGGSGLGSPTGTS